MTDPAFNEDDIRFMKLALQEAEKAADIDEVPVGAVIVAQGQVIARAHNLCERLRDFTAHAEMQAFTSASEFLGGKFLDHGAKDDKRGHSKVDGDLTMLHPKTTCQGGLLAEEAAALLTKFFQSKR